MAKASDILNLLVEKGSLQVKTGSKLKHDSLRTRLVKLYSRHKDLLVGIGADDGSSDLSMSGKFDIDTGTSTFQLKKAERKVGEEVVDYEIVGDTGG